MDTDAFEKTLQSIIDLNGTEGPNRNIFEPKYEARDQAEVLQKTIKSCMKDSDDEAAYRAQEQLARLYLFIGNNMAETEEDKDALVNLLRAYECIAGCVVHQRYDISEEPKADLPKLLAADKPITSSSTQWCCAASYAEILNSLGVFFANRDDIKQRLDDARFVLHVVESLYTEWDAAHKDCPSSAVPLNAESNLDEEALKKEADPKRVTIIRLRHRMDCIRTSNLFYLAQAYQAKADVRRSSKYCHLTLAEQLISRKEFSKKDWATNVLHLSGFYSAEGDYGAARYCLEAGQYLMPKEPADEETTGFVLWALGKFYRNRLRYYGEKKMSGSTDFDEHLHRAEWWCDFEIPIPGPKDMPKITTLEQAKQEFRQSNKYFQEALKYHPFDGCCTDHIAIHQDTCDLYNRLMAFEDDFLRNIAMQMRRVELVSPWVAELNFNAYGTLCRQLYFDVGDLLSDLLDMRLKQREKKLGKRLSDRKLNELQQRAQASFISFVESFREGGKLPTRFEKEVSGPFFRALMRIARLESRRAFKTPHEEYDAIDATIKRYEDAIKCAEVNHLEANPELREEVGMAKDMANLLPNKKNDIWKVHRQLGE